MFFTEKIKPRIIKEMKKCLNKAEKEEIRKHEQRIRILYRFRLQRLENAMVCWISYYIVNLLMILHHCFGMQLILEKQESKCNEIQTTNFYSRYE